MKISTKDTEYTPRAEAKLVTLTVEYRSENRIIDRMTPDEADILALALTKTATQARKGR